MLYSIKKVSEFIGKDYRTVVKMCDNRGIIIVEDGGKSISELQLNKFLMLLGYTGVEDFKTYIGSGAVE